MPIARDFAVYPWWWEDRRPTRSTEVADVPTSADVVVVGGGVTGLEAARALAAGGRDVVLCESGGIGDGASSRNAGQIGRNFKNSYSKMKKMWGPERARGVFDELQQAFDAVEALGEEYGEEIGWRRCGRIIAGMSPELAASLQTEYELRARELGEGVEVLSRDELRNEMHSDLYHGGIRLPNNGAVQPALYTQVLERRAVEAGAHILPHTAVIGIIRDSDRFTVATARGQIRARNVVIATNGYSGRAVPEVRKRLLPITSYMIATERMSPNRVQAILANARTYHDNRRRSHFFTVADEGRRILMGGRTGTIHRSEHSTLAALADDVTYIFPELQSVTFSHGWSGRCSAPLDLFPRFGELDGMHYALGYSFSGMAMGPHLARKVAQMILTPDAPPESYFARESFRPFPPFTRTALTTAIITQWYAEADRPRGLKRRI
jgi:glycine/D-amino acid oxidase-like deaminating enzyme